jgi:cytochrome c-type biogenesis protein
VELSAASAFVGLMAGALSTLSPCVLPLIPIIVGSAVAAHRWGALALAIGLALSFTIVGTLIAAMGAAIGLDSDRLRTIAAVLLVLFGGVMLSKALRERFAQSTSGLSNAGEGILSRMTPTGVSGQFMIGLLMGLVWSPCVGPTLGAAMTIASQGQNLVQVTLVMAAFGIGASLPLLLLGSMSRATLMRVRGSIANFGTRGQQMLGGALLLLGVLILTGYDRKVEIFALAALPQWMTDWSVRF